MNSQNEFTKLFSFASNRLSPPSRGRTVGDRGVLACNLQSDKLLDLSIGRGVVFTGLWVCKVLVVTIWVVPGGVWVLLHVATGIQEACDSFRKRMFWR